MAEDSTSPDPVGLVRRAFDAGNRHDIEAVVAFQASDSVWDLSDLGLGVFEGAAAIRGWLEDWFGAWAGLRLDVGEMVDFGHGVVFASVLEGGHPAQGGGHIEQQRGWAILGESGKIARTMIYGNIDEARAAAERLAQERADG
jgi:ketosteroid isomerase-like protein